MPGYVFGDLIGTRGQQKSPPTSQAHVSELAGPAPGVRTVYTPAFFAPEAMVGRYAPEGGNTRHAYEYGAVCYGAGAGLGGRPRGDGPFVDATCSPRPRAGPPEGPCGAGAAEKNSDF